MDDDAMLDLFVDIAHAVRAVLDDLDDWGLADTTPGQHHSDLAADEAALGRLNAQGLPVLSEESGWHADAGGVVVVVDPLDGSTNAAHGIPWFATSLCAVDDEGPRVALVTNQADGTTFTAVRGRGAFRDGVPIAPSGRVALRDAVVGLSGFPGRWLGWKQYRALGAAALDLCLVACGSLDAYIDCSHDAHGPWDYLGGVLICREAGATVGDALGRELVVLGHGDRRTPVAAATAGLFDEVVAARQTLA
jgi:fructose-1,6-bisphosphatase/inositol monophosphatase family enzyme